MIFISQWILKITLSMRHFFWAPKTNAKSDGFSLQFYAHCLSSTCLLFSQLCDKYHHLIMGGPAITPPHPPPTHTHTEAHRKTHTHRHNIHDWKLNFPKSWSYEIQCQQILNNFKINCPRWTEIKWGVTYDFQQCGILTWHLCRLTRACSASF